jgi:hypothetical protein
VISIYSCSNESSKANELEAKQIELEQKIDSLQLQVKQLEELVLTHNEILNDMLEPESGSLLHELENQ